MSSIPTEQTSSEEPYFPYDYKKIYEVLNGSEEGLLTKPIFTREMLDEFKEKYKKLLELLEKKAMILRKQSPSISRISLATITDWISHWTRKVRSGPCVLRITLELEKMSHLFYDPKISYLSNWVVSNIWRRPYRTINNAKNRIYDPRPGRRRRSLKDIDL